MQKKVFSMILAVLLLSNVAVFARGQLAGDTYEGTFQLEDETYPSIKTNDGKTYYMMPRFRIDEDKIPQNGDRLVIEAAVSRIAPNVLAVFSVEVNGEDIALEADDSDRSRRRGFHRGGGYGMGGNYHNGGKNKEFSNR